ncbi:G-patch domain [Arabidopsis thaliana x Arabidopsis arenosa]|uniref:G-patch domain n=1 Tax=Arabidopsis thaliana x Arabidopsis arenosa TaxID=1240361 RepID=A0A8T1Y916_9BRAS|nr:G-patch domain [Arabidopsis thaliana x Arabidopsis arenosa]
MKSWGFKDGLGLGRLNQGRRDIIQPIPLPYDVIRQGLGYSCDYIRREREDLLKQDAKYRENRCNVTTIHKEPPLEVQKERIDRFRVVATELSLQEIHTLPSLPSLPSHSQMQDYTNKGQAGTSTSWQIPLFFLAIFGIGFDGSVTVAITPMASSQVDGKAVEVYSSTETLPDDPCAIQDRRTVVSLQDETEEEDNGSGDEDNWLTKKKKKSQAITGSFSDSLTKFRTKAWRRATSGQKEAKAEAYSKQKFTCWDFSGDVTQIMKSWGFKDGLGLGRLNQGRRDIIQPIPLPYDVIRQGLGYSCDYIRREREDLLKQDAKYRENRCNVTTIHKEPPLEVQKERIDRFRVVATELSLQEIHTLPSLPSLPSHSQMQDYTNKGQAGTSSSCDGSVTVAITPMASSQVDGKAVEVYSSTETLPDDPCAIQDRRTVVSLQDETEEEDNGSGDEDNWLTKKKKKSQAITGSFSDSLTKFRTKAWRRATSGLKEAKAETYSKQKFTCWDFSGDVTQIMKSWGFKDGLGLGRLNQGRRDIIQPIPLPYDVIRQGLGYSCDYIRREREDLLKQDAKYRENRCNVTTIHKEPPLEVQKERIDRFRVVATELSLQEIHTLPSLPSLPSHSQMQDYTNKGQAGTSSSCDGSVTVAITPMASSQVDGKAVEVYSSTETLPDDPCAIQDRRTVVSLQDETEEEDNGSGDEDNWLTKKKKKSQAITGSFSDSLTKFRTKAWRRATSGLKEAKAEAYSKQKFTCWDFSGDVTQIMKSWGFKDGLGLGRLNQGRRDIIQPIPLPYDVIRQGLGYSCDYIRREREDLLKQDAKYRENRCNVTTIHKEPPLEVQKERIDRFRVVATELSLQEIHTLPSLPSLPSHSQMQDYTNKGQAGTSSSCGDEDNWLTKKKKKSQAITGSFSDSLTKFRTKAWRRATSGLKEAKAEAYSKQKFTCWDFSGDVTQIMKSWGFKDGLGLGRLNQGRRDIIQPIPLPYDVIRQGLGYSCDYIRREREDLLKQDAKYRENRCNVTTIHKEPPLEVQKERIDRFRVVATELSLQEIHTLPSLPSLPSHSQMQDYTNKGQAGTSSSCDGSVTVAITPMASSQVDGKAVEVYSSTETLPDDPCAIQDRRTVVSLQDETEEEDNGSGDEDNWLTKKKKKSQAITGSFSDSLTKFRTKAWRRATSGLKEAKAEAYSKQKFTCWDFSGDVTQIMKSWGFKDGLGLGRLNQGRRDIIQPIPLPYDVIRQGLGYSCDYIRREREDLLKQDAKYRENRCNVTTIHKEPPLEVQKERIDRFRVVATELSLQEIHTLPSLPSLPSHSQMQDYTNKGQAGTSSSCDGSVTVAITPMASSQVDGKAVEVYSSTETLPDDPCAIQDRRTVVSLQDETEEEDNGSGDEDNWLTKKKKKSQAITGSFSDSLTKFRTKAWRRATSGLKEAKAEAYSKQKFTCWDFSGDVTQIMKSWGFKDGLGLGRLNQGRRDIIQPIPLPYDVIRQGLGYSCDYIRREREDLLKQDAKYRENRCNVTTIHKEPPLEVQKERIDRFRVVATELSLQEIHTLPSLPSLPSHSQMQDYTNKGQAGTSSSCDGSVTVAITPMASSQVDGKAVEVYSSTETLPDDPCAIQDRRTVVSLQDETEEEDNGSGDEDNWLTKKKKKSQAITGSFSDSLTKFRTKAWRRATSGLKEAKAEAYSKQKFTCWDFSGDVTQIMKSWGFKDGLGLGRLNQGRRDIIQPIPLPYDVIRQGLGYSCDYIRREREDLLKQDAKYRENRCNVTTIHKEPPLEVQKERIDRFRVVATELSLQEIHTLPSLPSLPSHSQMQDYTNKGQAGTSSSCDGSVTVAITPMASSQVDGKAVEVYSSTETLPDDPCAIQDRRTVVSLQDETEEEDNGSGDEDNWLTKKKKKSQAITGSFSDSLTKFRTKAWRRATSGLKEAKAETYSKQKFTCWDFSGDVTQIMKSWGFKDGLGLGRLNQGRRDIIQPIPLPYDVIRQGLGYSCDYIRREREDLLKQDAKYRENRCNVTTIHKEPPLEVQKERIDRFRVVATELSLQEIHTLPSLPSLPSYLLDILNFAVSPRIRE